MVSTVASGVLLRQDEGGVATLTLNRPVQANALSRALLDALMAELGKIQHDESVRVVVVAGAGRAFCAGHDLKELRGQLQETKEKLRRTEDELAAFRTAPTSCGPASAPSARGSSRSG